MAVKRKFILPSGEVKAEEEMSPDELGAFRKKLAKLLLPLAIEAAIKDLQREKAEAV